MVVIKIVRLGWIILFFLTLAGCSGHVNGVPEPHKSSDSQVASGRRLLAGYGCGSCHSIPGVPGADSLAGPPLDRYYERSYIAGRLANSEENLVKWIMAPQQIEPGNAMPNLGVQENEARDMAAYLYHQPSISDIFIR